MSWLRSVKKAIVKQIHKPKYDRESFRARMCMEKNAQEHISHRLEVIEINFKNQGRLK